MANNGVIGKQPTALKASGDKDCWLGAGDTDMGSCGDGGADQRG